MHFLSVSFLLQFGWILTSIDDNLYVLLEDEMAFDMLYCVAFEMLDAHWLAMRASYMEFNVTLSLCPFCHVNWGATVCGSLQFYQPVNLGGKKTLCLLARNYLIIMIAAHYHARS
jgi:hypothetical protein